MWLTADGVQRGTLWNVFGDPQTPEFPSFANAPKVPFETLWNEGVLPSILVSVYVCVMCVCV